MTFDSAVVLCLVAFLYFLPALVANHRRHHNQAAIFTLNLFLGWTFVGWVVALVWASTAVTKKLARRPCPQCGESALVTAAICPFCRNILPRLMQRRGNNRAFQFPGLR